MTGAKSHLLAYMMSSTRNKLFAGVLAPVWLFIVSSIGFAGPPIPVVVAVDPAAPQNAISPEAEGLSYESAVLRPNSGGGHYFRPSNAPLIRLFKSLGIKSLRLGGVTIDRTNLLITQTDVDELFQFARAADVKVIYSFRLKDGDLEAMKPLARHILNDYSANLDCIAIGNEPNEFMTNYAAFEPAWTPFMDALSRENPAMKFCAPCAWREDWARRFSDNLSVERMKKMAFVAQHEYPFGPGKLVKDPAVARDAMLSIKNYDKWYQRFVPAVLHRGLRYRLEEAGNFSNGGAADVSDTYAAALWGLDCLYWWCSHQALGINFHTGDFQRYSAFKTADGGYAIRPLAYGLLAFSLGGHGEFITAKTDMPTNAVLDLKAYATRDPAGGINLTLINRSHGVAAEAAQVMVKLPASAPDPRAEVCFLTAPEGDVAAKTGITVGGAEVNGDGSWHGQWTRLHATATTGQVQVTVPAASAAILKFTAIHDAISPRHDAK